MSIKRLVVPTAVGMLAAAAALGVAAPIANASGTWAAIAVSPDNEISGWGYTYLASSQAEAESSAMSQCYSYGNASCQIAISAYSGCIALADSPESWATGQGASVSEAEADALVNNGGGTILESGCTGV